MSTQSRHPNIRNHDDLQSVVAPTLQLSDLNPWKCYLENGIYIFKTGPTVRSTPDQAKARFQPKSQGDRSCPSPWTILARHNLPIFSAAAIVTASILQ